MYVGKVIIDDLSNQAITQRKAKINKKIINISFVGNSENIPLFNELYVFVIECYEENNAKAYRTVEEGKILLIARSEENEDTYTLALEEYSSESEQELIFSNFFQGEYRTEISGAPGGLIKKYDPTGNTKMILAVIGSFTVIGLVIGLYFISVAHQEEEARARAATAAAQVSQKVIAPLSPIEIQRIKRLLTMNLVDRIRNEARIIGEDTKLNGRASVRSVSITYETIGEEVKLHGSFGYEYSYPVEGSALSGDNLYTKVSSFEIAKNRHDLEGVTKNGMSVECLRLAMKLPSGEPVVVERTPGQIKIKYSSLSPTDLTADFRKIIDQCPIEIETIGMAGNRFEMISSVYEGEDQ